MLKNSRIQKIPLFQHARDDLEKTLIVNGLWLEEGFQADAAYRAAYERGLAHFARFLGAKRVDTGKMVSNTPLSFRS